jgi:predicted DNA-binding transcriptional regulator YafY
MPKIQKPQENSKYSRINQIYEQLSINPTGITIGDLAKQLEVSTKTIQRDLYEVLAEFGAVKEGRYWKIDTKKANDNLGANERIILGILDEMAKGGGKTFYGKAHSLLAQVSQQLEHPFFANNNNESLDETNIESFEILEKAIKQKSEVSLLYKNWDFQVKPLKLAFFDGFWYLLVLDSNDKDTFKKFHLKSIKNISVLNKSFEVPKIAEERLLNAHSVWFNLSEPFSIRLLIAKDVRHHFERKPLKSQMIMGEDKDGSIEIEMFITDEMEIVPMILWFIPYVKVLEPQWLVDVVKDRVKKYLHDIE